MSIQLRAAMYTSERTSVPELIRQQISFRPNAAASTAPHRELTYAQLGSMADHIGEKLRSLGVKKDDVVALCVPASPEFIAAAIAAMSIGAAYLAIDENCPAERVSFMLADSGASVLITISRLASVITVPVHSSVLEIDRLGKRKADPKAALAVSEIHPDDLAYIIYTSGSTGRPKGVELTHRGLSNLVSWHNQAFGITYEDRSSQIANLSFDAAVWEIWPPLTRGAALCIPENEARQNPVQLQKWFVRQRITVAFAPTVIAERLIQMEWPRKTALRFLLTGGEALRTYPRHGLPFAFVNNYGPTECTVVTTSGLVAPDDGCGAAPSIGRPIAHAEVHILDADLKPVAPGEIGELCVGGPSLARGYRNSPELTAEKFIRNPFDSAPSARLYRTGDLVKMSADGQLHFFGRIDDQVKIRGYRIEPNEIGFALQHHPAVRQCVVVARSEDDDPEKQLVAYIVLFPSVRVSPLDLRKFLGKALPDYMIPSSFVLLDELPLTANGKVNRAALPCPQRSEALGPRVLESPATELQRQIATMIRALLGIDEIGIEDNFFLLGGHSLLGAQLTAQLRKRFKVDLPLLALFEAPTVAGLAALIERLRADHGQMQQYEMARK